MARDTPITQSTPPTLGKDVHVRSGGSLQPAGRISELVIKQALNRPGATMQPAESQRTELDTGWQELPLHRAPLNRLLVSQTKADSCLLTTADQPLTQHIGPIRRMVTFLQ